MVKSPPAPRTAPLLPVIVASTLVDVLSREEEPANRAVKVTSRGDTPSTTDPGSADRVMAESSSCTVTSAVAFSNREAPSSSNVSGPSTTASWFMVSPVNFPGREESTAPAGMVTVLAAVGEYENSVAPTRLAPAGVAAFTSNVTTVSAVRCEAVTVSGKEADTFT